MNLLDHQERQVMYPKVKSLNHQIVFVLNEKTFLLIFSRKSLNLFIIIIYCVLLFALVASEMAESLSGLLSKKNGYSFNFKS
jgi:hypothetical protein